jgi:hypothetical protein
MDTKRYLRRRWTRAALTLSVLAILFWPKMNNDARIFISVAVPVTIAIALFFYFGGFKKSKSSQGLKPKPSTENEPQKRNPPAQLPHLRKQS